MGTAAWGGSGEGKCFPCHGLSWWRLLLYFPSQPHRTAVRPKLSAVSVIRLFVRTRQPSATLASPLVCMRETTSLALRSVLHKETSRWSAATTPQEPRVSIDHLSQKLMKNQVFSTSSVMSHHSHTPTISLNVSVLVSLVPSMCLEPVKSVTKYLALASSNCGILW